MITFCLEKHVPHGKSLVHNQNLRLNIDCHRKGKAHKHTAGIGLYRLVHIGTDIREFQNLRQFGVNLPVGKSHHGPVQVHVLYPVVFHVKAGSQFQKGRNAPVYPGLAGCGTQYPGDNLQYGRFSGAVGADNAHGFSLINIQADTVQGIVKGMRLFPAETKRLLHPVPGPVIQLVYLHHIFDLYGGNIHFLHLNVLLSVFHDTKVSASCRFLPV